MEIRPVATTPCTLRSRGSARRPRGGTGRPYRTRHAAIAENCPAFDRLGLPAWMLSGRRSKNERKQGRRDHGHRHFGLEQRRRSRSRGRGRPATWQDQFHPLKPATSPPSVLGRRQTSRTLDRTTFLRASTGDQEEMVPNSNQSSRWWRSTWSRTRRRSTSPRSSLQRWEI